MRVHLIGPGGAGKSTTGPPLARKLKLSFVDLDKMYLKTRSIDADVDELGYEFYVRTNIELYLDMLDRCPSGVIALSSGFMTYDSAIHPRIQQIHREILADGSTVLLLPSFNLEECVTETVKRQLGKSHNRTSAEHQVDLINKRFHIYKPMGNIKITTNKSTPAVVEDIVSQLSLSFVKNQNI